MKAGGELRSARTTQRVWLVETGEIGVEFHLRRIGGVIRDKTWAALVTRKTHLESSFLDCVHEEFQGGCLWVMDLVLDADEAGEGGGSEAEDAQEAHGIFDVEDLIRVLEQAADVDTEHGDLVEEVEIELAVEVGDIDGAEVTGIKAMLEGIGIERLGAAQAARELRFLGHRRLLKVKEAE
jgi:hypothetical protein